MTNGATSVVLGNPKTLDIDYYLAKEGKTQYCLGEGPKSIYSISQSESYESGMFHQIS